MRLFSTRDRPVHLGPYPLERLTRAASLPPLAGLPPMRPLSFDDPDPLSLSHAMARFIAMFDVIRDGPVNPQVAEIPDDPRRRAEHLKAAGYYFDASMMGLCRLPDAARLATPIRNPDVAAMARELETSQPRSFAAGLDMILADVLESARLPHGPIDDHAQALVVLVEYPRDPRPGEPGCDWIVGTQAQRAAVLAAQTAVLLASYLRLLGFAARSHTACCSDVDLARLAVAAGLAYPVSNAVSNAATDPVAGPAATAEARNPYLGTRYGLAAVTTTCAFATDAPLAPPTARRRWRSHGPDWLAGRGTARRAAGREPYRHREFRQGAHPFERLRRKDEPTTFIDHERVPRFPKRADFFARALFGDLGKDVQEQSRNAHYVMKSPIGACARRALGALLLLQFGDAREGIADGRPEPVRRATQAAREAARRDPVRNADNLKAASHYLGSDAVGLCAVPAWAWYSHDAGGNPIVECHANSVNLLIDQGHETMEGASGDDWISVAQSMRAYLRFSMIGGIVAEQIRRLGYAARVHSVLDGDVLQPPLLLLSGLGEVSRIGEVILNPFLGPRLKSGAVTTDLPMQADRPIDFGLQRFCEACNKCARECPSGAITAGPKVMYNGYEIWKSDAEKCARYRITNAGGGMCGRCMKTCPWNLEGLFADDVFRWAATNLPSQARRLAALDDRLGRGAINPVKTWWWDIELDRDPARTPGRYVKAAKTNRRGLNRDLVLRAEDQTLAVYPADRMPPPFPVAHPVDREEGIARYRSLPTPAQYRARLAAGDTDGLAPPFRMPAGEPPVFPVVLARRVDVGPDLMRLEFRALPPGDAKPGGSKPGDARAGALPTAEPTPATADLPPFEAGAHIDVVIAPEYLRQYSLAGDPADRGRWVVAVQREPAGRGGSMLMHRAFREGRRVFVSRPIQQFALDETASAVLLFGGGIGITPLLTMAHRLHALGRPFALHYSLRRRADGALLPDIEAAPWRAHARVHVAAEGGRADLAALVPHWRDGLALYACGSARYMDAVYAAAQARGWPAPALHRELFAAPAEPARVDRPFVVELARSGRRLDVPVGRSATDVLAEAGVPVDVKCSDGLCGVCAVAYDAAASDPVEHRDHVLSAVERTRRVVLCRSRSAVDGGLLKLDR